MWKRRCRRKEMVASINGEIETPTGREPMTDPGGKVYQDSDWALKTNERSLAKNMPLLSEFTRCGEWGSQQKYGQRRYTTMH